MVYLMLNDPGSHRQRVVSMDHVSAFEINKTDHLITLFLMGGQEIHLSLEESRQFLHHMKSKIARQENGSS